MNTSRLWPYRLVLVSYVNIIPCISGRREWVYDFTLPPHSIPPHWSHWTPVTPPPPDPFSESDNSVSGVVVVVPAVSVAVLSPAASALLLFSCASLQSIPVCSHHLWGTRVPQRWWEQTRIDWRLAQEKCESAEAVGERTTAEPAGTTSATPETELSDSEKGSGEEESLGASGSSGAEWSGAED